LSATTVPTQPITLLVCALGGEGGGVLSEWLYGAAVRAGFDAQATSIPGVAQRTGATTYYLEVAPQPRTTLGGRRPVFGLNPVPGEIDLLISSELLETVRQVGNGMASPDRTLVVSSTARALTVAEKMQLADGRADSAALVATLQKHAQRAELLDLAALAREAGTVISAVLLGAIAATGRLPIPRTVFEDAIRASGKGVDASLRGFALAFDAVTARAAQRSAAEAAVAAALQPPDLRALARDKLTRWQDAAYAQLYEQRLDRVATSERVNDPLGTLAGDITQEVTRWLALWMAFDDIVHVARLKLAASREQRVRREVAARDDEIVKLYDHFKPGVPECAGLLPEPWAGKLLAWDRRRVAAGRAPWALPLKLGTHTVTGVLALRLVAGLKGWRRRGARHALEQSLIERWLAAVERGTREHAPLGLELARAGRLVKGYGSTNERGKEHLLHLIDHLAFGAGSAEQRAAAVRATLAAALADDAGRAFDAALVAHGAPKRAPREQTIRFYKRRPAA
jgi:indolepyruvate ferredoxin oxidoreductase beta subunit